MTSPLSRSLAVLALVATLVACGSDGEPGGQDGTAAAPSEDVATAAGLPEQARDLATANGRADLNVVVVGQQWSWTFSYTKGGTSLSEPVWEGGNQDEPPTLWLVAGRSVTFTLFSPDVIHSFWPTDFLFKMDVVPGRAARNFFTVTPSEEGRFTGRCAELCGAGHSDMLFDVNVVDQAAFDRHLEDLAAAGQTGLKAPAGYAEEISAG